MNIIYLHAHDMGRINSVYGHNMPTPHLRAFASESTTFRQAFCSAPTCSPSRVALLTGASAHEAGVLGLIHRGFRLNNPERHLARYLAAQGYETCLCGVQHEVPFGEEGTLYQQVHVQDSLQPIFECETDLAHADCAVAYLEAPKEKPFFLSLGLFAPHRAFLEPDPARFNPDFVAPLGNLPDTPEIRRDIAGYQASLELADEAFGRVLTAIFRCSLQRDSIIIVTTDHGVAFPGAKCTLKDTGMGVTLMMRVPGQEKLGGPSDALVSHLDVFPTLCDYAELPPPAWLQGHSLRPILKGTESAIRDELFAEINYHAAYEPMRCIRTATHKYIRLFDSDHRCRLPNIDPSPAKDEFLRMGLLSGHPGCELYDLMSDPHEQRNLSGQTEVATLEHDLSARLDQWMLQTHDPLLQGVVPRPIGAKINDF